MRIGVMLQTQGKGRHASPVSQPPRNGPINLTAALGHSDARLSTMSPGLVTPKRESVKLRRRRTREQCRHATASIVSHARIDEAAGAAAIERVRARQAIRRKQERDPKRRDARN
jgi:hypothetical protein